MVAETNKAQHSLFRPNSASITWHTKAIQYRTAYNPAQWQELDAVKVAMLIADRDTASLNDPLSRELLTVRERSLTSDRLSFSSVEQNIPGFSLCSSR